jgi:RNA polymerase sigma factor (sigma-70 family)
MTTPPTSAITQLLAAAGQGDQAAHDRLWSAIYDGLHRLAQWQMAGEAPGRTLQTTALVHEAYLRLVGNEDVQWANRRQFFAAAAKVMRRIRIDDARKRARLKRGGVGVGTRKRDQGIEGSRDQGERPRGLKPAALPVEEVGATGQDPAEMLAVDEALSKLEREDARKAEIVMLRFFVGLTMDEIAAVMELSPRTVDVEWRFARAWLHRQLSGE